MSEAPPKFDSFSIYKNIKENKIILEIPDIDDFESIFGKVNENPQENGKIEADPIEIFISEDESIPDTSSEDGIILGIAFWRSNAKKNDN
jgi:hypothetical protein